MKIDIDIFVIDQTLPLSTIDEVLGDHPVITGNQLRYRITPVWGGPAASGLDIEIAVLIVATQLLRDVQSDIYGLAKAGILSLYQHIRPSTEGAARAYTDAVMALCIQGFYESTDLRFCFPPDLTEGELAELWNDVEQHWEPLAEKWRTYLEDRLGGRSSIHSLNLVFDRDAGEWVIGDDQLDDAESLANQEES